MRIHAPVGVALLVISDSCLAPKGDTDLGDHLAAYVSTGSNPMRISTLTDFEWDRLHVFTPYTSWQDVEAELGFPWPERRRIHLEEREWIKLRAPPELATRRSSASIHC